MDRTLFQLSDELLALDETLNALEGDVTEAEAIDAHLDSLTTDINRKLDGYSYYIAELTARAEVQRGEAGRLIAKARTNEERVKSLKERLAWFFTRHGYKTIETDTFRFTLSRAGGKAPMVFDPDDIPDDYKKTTVMVAPDLDLIRDALEKGIQLPFARLDERKKYVRIS